VPAVGDGFEAHGHRFTVTEMDGRRVARVRIAPPTPTADDLATPPGPAAAPER
jgi:putative hemolysin